MQGSQTFAGEDIGTIVNTVTPIVASVLQSRAWQQPSAAFGSPMMPGLGWQGTQSWPSGFGQGIYGQGALGQGGFGQAGFGQAGVGHAGFGQAGFGQRGFAEEIGQVVATVIPAVVAGLGQ